MTKDLIHKIAIRTFNQEIATLMEVKEQISPTFGKVIELLHKSTGRIVITGIGKSAIIGQKIVATLNSTGTPSIFLHAGDAVHGDIGILHGNDVVICLSKSGETEELKVFLPLLNSMDIPVIALVSQLDSFLAQQATYTLFLPVREEADPHNLAPTNSTTAQLVMGDAIAIALLEVKGFTRDQFAVLHPGGSLGKKLFLKVRDLIRADHLPTLSPDANIRTALIEMTSHRQGAAVVTAQDESPLGIITDGDLRRMLQSNANTEGLTAEHIMSIQPKSIDIDAKAVEALDKMRTYSITQLVVVNEGRYSGIIHIHDLLREGIL